MRSHSWLYDEHRKGVDKIKALEQENERLKKELEEMKALKESVRELRAAIKNHKEMTLHEFGESLAVADNHLWSTFDSDS